MGLYRVEVTELEFTQEMQKAYPGEYSVRGLECLYRYLVKDSNYEMAFNPSEIHAEYTEYKGLGDYNARRGTLLNNIGDVPCIIQFADLNGFIQN